MTNGTNPQNLEPQIENLSQLLAKRTEECSTKTFLFSEIDGRQYSYQEFSHAVQVVARLLSNIGIGRGDTVSLLLPNSIEYIIGYFACFSIGAVAGPVNSLLKAEEISFVLSNSDARAILVGSEFLPVIEAIRPSLPALEAVILFDDWEMAVKDIQSEADAPTQTDIDLDSDAIIIYTSGTTGKPKGCLLTHGNLISNARQISEWLGFGPGDRLLTMMPLFHMNAVSVTTMSALYAGGSTVVSRRFSASKFWNILSDYKVTSFGSVATMLSMLLSTYPNGVPEGLDTSRLRFAMCGSAPVPAEVMRKFEETFNCLVIEGYGLSESTCRSTFNPPDRRRRPGSCGLPIGNEMMVFDDDDHPVETGELGEIVLRGDNILKGYYRNPEATERAFRNGWFHTGDVGYRDADGFFFIVDRKSDMVIRGGENIYPREIDEVLFGHPAVASAATVGVPDPLYGEEVAAFVVKKAESEVTGEELLAYCKKHLADYKCPKSIFFLADIPKGPTGKLLKRELVRMYKERSG